MRERERERGRASYVQVSKTCTSTVTVTVVRSEISMQLSLDNMSAVAERTVNLRIPKLVRVMCHRCAPAEFKRKSRKSFEKIQPLIRVIL